MNILRQFRRQIRAAIDHYGSYAVYGLWLAGCLTPLVFGRVPLALEYVSCALLWGITLPLRSVIPELVAIIDSGHRDWSGAGHPHTWRTDAIQILDAFQRNWSQDRREMLAVVLSCIVFAPVSVVVELWIHHRFRQNYRRRIPLLHHLILFRP